MRRIAPLLMAAVLSIPVIAQDASAPRFAIFVPDALLQNTNKGKKLLGELEALGKGLQDKLQGKAAEGQKLQQQLQSGSLSEDGKEKLTKQLRDLEYDLKKQQEESQVEFQKAQQRVYGQFQQEVGPIVEALAKERKLQVVFQYQPNQNMFAYTDPAWGLEFTNEVAKRYDATSGPITGPATKPAPTKPPVKK
jgi:Skp family chaperone for outer membrane proteins